MEFFLSLPHRVAGPHSLGGNASRRCGFEYLEPRQLLAADLVGGADGFVGQSGGPTGGISGSVFATPAAIHSTSNCDSHAAAVSLAEVRVQLLDATGAVLEESTTDATGAYHFADLFPGQYSVRQIMQHGFLDEDDVALGSQLVNEIAVQAGVTLEGYDFCELVGTAEPAVQFLPFLTLPSVSAPAARQEIADEPTVESAADVALVDFSPFSTYAPRSAEVYGGSSRTLKKPTSIKAWDEFPIDSYFSTASFLELATGESPNKESLEPMLQESILGNSIFDESDLASAPARDDALAEGPSANTPAWWEIDAQSEFAELLGDTEVIDLAIEAAGVPTDEAVAEIALLQNAG